MSALFGPRIRSVRHHTPFHAAGTALASRRKHLAARSSQCFRHCCARWCSSPRWRCRSSSPCTQHDPDRADHDGRQRAGPASVGAAHLQGLLFHPDLFGGTLTVIRDICAGLKDTFSAAVLVCSRLRRRAADRGQRRRGRARALVWRRAVKRRRRRPIHGGCGAAFADHDLLALHAPFPLADLVFALGSAARRPLVVHWHADIVSHAALRFLVEAADAANSCGVRQRSSSPILF